MKENRISRVLTDAEYKQVKSLLKQLNTLLEFGVQLTPEERKKLLTAGDKRSQFISQIKDNLNLIEKYLPPYIDKDEFLKDATLFEQLQEIRMILLSILDKVEDAIYIVSNESYKESLNIYDALKSTAKRGNIAGLDPLLSNLKKLLGKGRKKTSNEEE